MNDDPRRWTHTKGLANGNSSDMRPMTIAIRDRVRGVIIKVIRRSTGKVCMGENSSVQHVKVHRAHRICSGVEPIVCSIERQSPLIDHVQSP